MFRCWQGGLRREPRISAISTQSRKAAKSLRKTEVGRARTPLRAGAPNSDSASFFFINTPLQRGEKADLPEATASGNLCKSPNFVGADKNTCKFLRKIEYFFCALLEMPTFAEISFSSLHTRENH